MAALLASASVIVVPSFDEGLSLPILEAVSAGTPIVASDIAAHRELIGSGSFLANPTDLDSFAAAISRHISRAATHAKQKRNLAGHTHITGSGNHQVRQRTPTKCEFRQSPHRSIS